MEAGESVQAERRARAGAMGWASGLADTMQRDLRSEASKVGGVAAVPPRPPGLFSGGNKRR